MQIISFAGKANKPHTEQAKSSGKPAPTLNHMSSAPQVQGRKPLTEDKFTPSKK